jgi:hypothetical protein
MAPAAVGFGMPLGERHPPEEGDFLLNAEAAWRGEGIGEAG